MSNPEMVGAPMGGTAERWEPNGAGWAALLAGAIGSFAVGFFAFIGALDLYTPPTIYEPAGGVSGRTTAAVVVWLLAWGVLHWRWKANEVRPAPIALGIAVLLLLGIVGTIPWVWDLF